MSDRTELLEAALDSLPGGILLVDRQEHVRFWNQAAEAITGFSGADLLGRPVLDALAPLAQCCAEGEAAETEVRLGNSSLVHVQHKLGHEASLMVQRLLLRNDMGGRIGTAYVFHLAESLEALPHGESSEEASVEKSQAVLDQQLETLYRDFVAGGPPFGVLWITVDQAHDLRKTHGARACEGMIEKVEHALSHGLRPNEQMGRWGEDEFLVISHERTRELLTAHAKTLAGLARTADFRWWGDRVSLTVSIGTAQAEPDGSLVILLERAKAAMFSSFEAGGNQITSAPEGSSCLPS